MQKLRIDWKMSEIVKPEDFNRIGEVVNGLGEKVTDLSAELENKVNLGTPQLFNPEDILASGFIRRPYDGYYYKNPFGEVTVCVSVEKENNEPIRDLDTILMLPEGFRPRSPLELPAIYHSPWAAAYIRIDTNGRVMARMADEHLVLSVYFSFIVTE